MTLPALILASSSPRRQELLRQFNIAFEVVPSDAEELHLEELTARETALVNAYRKARVVAKRLPDAVILAADTLVYLDHTLYGKPVDSNDAVRMLNELQGRTHEVVTGVCLMHLRAHRQKLFAESTDVRFRPLLAQEIKHYLSSINPLDKAGGYAIQENGEFLVEEVSGSYSNVIGLPMERLRAELEAWMAD